MITNGQFAIQLSEDIKRRLFALPGASKAISELSEGAMISALLTLLADMLMRSTDRVERENAGGSIQALVAGLESLIARLPIETPFEFENALAVAQYALTARGFAPGRAANQPSP